MKDLINKVEFKGVRDIYEAYELESQCYPEDEAASIETMTSRFKQAPDLFYGAFLDNELIGLVMATATQSKSITKESMTLHDPNGRIICIHSVCTHPDYRKLGLASKMLQNYIDILREWRQKRVSIIVHEYLVPFYTKLGFKVRGVSDIVHGPDPWLEMNLELIDGTFIHK
ncbi:hypothetical protein HDV01_000117 [Terramyces sp. JEL0728]|nr:hypothetical protein HDV01_000117 [Terramyces sp. JEL0728]